MDKQKGLYNKYMVVKVVDGTVIENCFILRPDKDPAAVKALQAYAAAADNGRLAYDIWAWVGRPLQKPLTREELRGLHTPCVAILEDRTDMSIRPVTIWRVDDLSVQLREDYGIWLDEYGLTKRLWMCGEFRNPTDEERLVALWEE